MKDMYLLYSKTMDMIAEHKKKCDEMNMSWYGTLFLSRRRKKEIKHGVTILNSMGMELKEAYISPVSGHVIII